MKENGSEESRPSPMLLIAQGCLESDLSLDEAVKLLEKHIITEALRTAGHGGICQAARDLRVHRNTLMRKMAALKIPSPRRAGRPPRKEAVRKEAVSCRPSAIGQAGAA